VSWATAANIDSTNLTQSIQNRVVAQVTLLAVRCATDDGKVGKWDYPTMTG